MGFWNKLGQIALQAAPYVAAPFTGGLSLTAAPLTGQFANKLEDRSDRQEYEKTGVAPSRSMMNKIMGGVNTAAGMYGGGKIAGRLGGGASTPPIVPTDQAGGLTGFLRNYAMNNADQGFGILSNLGQRSQPNQQAMNSPYADPRDAMAAQRPRSSPSAAIQRGRNKARAY